jgi:hypothetical protein
MLPALCLLRISQGRGFLFPLPLFLLWPLVALAWIVVLPVRFLAPQASAAGKGALAAWTALAALGQLSGLDIDVSAADGAKVRIRFI